MGMFDTLVDKNGEESQIKIFKIPSYDYNYKQISGSGILFSGGMLRVFNEDDNIPYNSFCYDYGKDFMVIVEEMQYSDNWMIALFSEGKFNGFCSKEKFKKINSKQMKNVYDYHGEKLRINSMKTLLEYFNDTFRMRDIDSNEKLEEWNWVKIKAKWNLPIEKRFLSPILNYCLQDYTNLSNNKNMKDFFNDKCFINKQLEAIKDEIELLK